MLSTLHDSSLDPVILLTTRLLAFVNTWCVVEVSKVGKGMFGILELFDRVLFFLRGLEILSARVVYILWMILLDEQCFFFF